MSTTIFYGYLKCEYQRNSSVNMLLRLIQTFGIVFLSDFFYFDAISTNLFAIM